MVVRTLLGSDKRFQNLKVLLTKEKDLIKLWNRELVGTWEGFVNPVGALRRLQNQGRESKIEGRHTFQRKDNFVRDR